MQRQGRRGARRGNAERVAPRSRQRLVNVSADDSPDLQLPFDDGRELGAAFESLAIETPHAGGKRRVVQR